MIRAASGCRGMGMPPGLGLWGYTYLLSYKQVVIVVTQSFGDHVVTARTPGIDSKASDRSSHSKRTCGRPNLARPRIA